MTDTLSGIKPYLQFINGAWVDAADGATLTVENPATGEAVGTVSASDQEDVDRAVDAAADAFDTWSLTTLSETPHGGVKESGWGKDGSRYALEDYTAVQQITINTGV